MYKKAWHWTLF